MTGSNGMVNTFIKIDMNWINAKDIDGLPNGTYICKIRSERHDQDYHTELELFNGQWVINNERMEEDHILAYLEHDEEEPILDRIFYVPSIEAAPPMVKFKGEFYAATYDTKEIRAVFEENDKIKSPYYIHAGYEVKIMPSTFHGEVAKICKR